MADNMSVTPGTGATIAAADVGSGVLAQRFKLAMGTAAGGSGSYVDLNPATAAVQAAQSGAQAIPVALTGNWAATSTAAVGSASSASKAAGAAGVRHVCTALSFGWSATTALGGITTVTINLRDGATGAGTVLWAFQVTLAAAVQTPVLYQITGLSLVGSAATAMTLEFSAAVGNLLTFANFSGYDVS